MRRLRYASILVGLVAAIVPVLPAGAGPAVTTPNDPLFRNDQHPDGVGRQREPGVLQDPGGEPG